MKKQDFKVLKTKDLYPFPDNPFHVAEDETLSELAESIKEFGIVTPIITRPKEDGNGYEVIAGQRRVRASELAGINTVPAFVLPLDRDRAIITLVDSNLQRENILPSERAFAYKMKSEAMKRQAALQSFPYGAGGTAPFTLRRSPVARADRLFDCPDELCNKVPSASQSGRSFTGAAAAFRL